MLTSERKLQKLFIKFVEWGKIKKANQLMQSHPNLIIPWQKAFECAAMNQMLRGAEWVYNQAKCNGLDIDTHFENDKLLNHLILQQSMYFIKWLLALEPNYPWRSKITSENLSRARQDILVIIPA